MSISQLVAEIERRSQTHEIGRLQEIRKELKSKTRLPAHIFHNKTIKDTYAFHYGGRKELQFNIGTEPDDRIRHGVAFSFEPSPSLLNLDVLVRSVKRFNDFLRKFPNHYPDMRMWYWDEKKRTSAHYLPMPIEPYLIRKGMFIFMGKMQPSKKINFDIIIEDFDRLLTLYRFVEGQETQPVLLTRKGFLFKPGCTLKSSKTRASYAERELDVALRHNGIQIALYKHLCSQYRNDNVGTEIPNVDGRVDVVVRQNGRYSFYEIKTALTTRECISEALAQLVEYSYWPGAQEAERLVIIGEAALDLESEQYLSTLRQRLSIPVEYEQFDLDNGKIVHQCKHAVSVGG